MKKKLSLLLVIVLAFSISSVCLAADAAPTICTGKLSDSPLVFPKGTLVDNMNIEPPAQAAVQGPSVSTVEISDKPMAIDPGARDITIQSLKRPTDGIDLPHSGAFYGVSSEIFSNYYFYTKNSTSFGVNWSVRSDDQRNVPWHINVYQAKTNKFVVSTKSYSTTSYVGTYTTTISNLDPAYSYYISFVNDGTEDGMTISGDYTAHF